MSRQKEKDLDNSADVLHVFMQDAFKGKLDVCTVSIITAVTAIVKVFMYSKAL